jgi:hypothetical protein
MYFTSLKIATNEMNIQNKASKETKIKTPLFRPKQTQHCRSMFDFEPFAGMMLAQRISKSN